MELILTNCSKFVQNVVKILYNSYSQFVNFSYILYLNLLKQWNNVFKNVKLKFPIIWSQKVLLFLTHDTTICRQF